MQHHIVEACWLARKQCPHVAVNLIGHVLTRNACVCRAADQQPAQAGRAGAAGRGHQRAHPLPGAGGRAQPGGPALGAAAGVGGGALSSSMA